VIAHPISVTDLTGDPTTEWPALVTITHEGPIQVVKPPGIDRPAKWTGIGGLTPDPNNNDLWHVAAGSSEPAAILNLASRKWARLNRIVWQDENLPGMMKHRDLLIINRPNLDQVDGEYLDPEDERIPENEWHWQNYAYAKLRLKAPRDAGLEIVVDYSTVSASDPCYPTLEPGEFTWERQQHQVTYRVHIDKTPEGEDYSSVVFDLAVPQKGDVAPVLYHVDRITIRILGTAQQDEDWEFDDIYLLDKYWVEDWGDEPDSCFKAREYDPWDYFLADYTGFAGVVNGLRCFNIPYGYEEYERTERSLKQRQKWRSRNEGVGIMDYAKPLQRLCDEVYWQRGWAATYHDPEESSANEDSDENKLFGTFRWWDLLRHHEYAFDDPPHSNSQEICGAPIVRTWYIAAGIKHVIYYEKFAQGRPHGIAVKSDRSGRMRREGSVSLQGRESGGKTWAEMGTVVPDAHGRFRLGPALEKDREYRLGGSEEIFQLANVRYTWQIAGLQIEDRNIWLMRDLLDNRYVFWEDGDDVKFCALERYSFRSFWGTQVAVANAGMPSAVKKENGLILLAVEQDGGIAIYWSRNRREFKRKVATLEGSKPCIMNGPIADWLLFEREGKLRVRRTSDWFKSWMTFTMGDPDDIEREICDAPANGRAVGIRSRDGRLLVAVPRGSQIEIWVSKSAGRRWELQTTVEGDKPFITHGPLVDYFFFERDGTIWARRTRKYFQDWVAYGIGENCPGEKPVCDDPGPMVSCIKQFIGRLILGRSVPEGVQLLVTLNNCRTWRELMTVG